MDKTKEEYIHFIRHAMLDKSRKSNEFIELYQFLLGCFVRADANLDGQVTVDEFDVMVEVANELPRRYGLAPKNEDLYPTAEARKAARAKLFEEMDANHDGHLTFEEWLAFCIEDIESKMHQLPKDVLCGSDSTKAEFVTFIKKAMDRKSSEFRELFIFLLKCFVDADKDRDGAIQEEEFDTMVEVATSGITRHGLAPSTKSLYKSDAERRSARKALFKQIDCNNDGSISFDEWFSYAFEDMGLKVSKL